MTLCQCLYNWFNMLLVSFEESTLHLIVYSLKEQMSVFTVRYDAFLWAKGSVCIRLFAVTTSATRVKLISFSLTSSKVREKEMIYMLYIRALHDVSVLWIWPRVHTKSPRPVFSNTPAYEGIKSPERFAELWLHSSNKTKRSSFGSDTLSLLCCAASHSPVSSRGTLLD